MMVAAETRSRPVNLSALMAYSAEELLLNEVRFLQRFEHAVLEFAFVESLF